MLLLLKLFFKKILLLLFFYCYCYYSHLESFNGLAIKVKNNIKLIKPFFIHSN